MDDFPRLERLAAMLRDDDGFNCPHCGFRHEITDCDVCQQVVSFWGEEPHEFSCFQCGADFLVKETVIRKFEAARPDTGNGEG